LSVRGNYFHIKKLWLAAVIAHALHSTKVSQKSMELGLQFLLIEGPAGVPQISVVHLLLLSHKVEKDVPMFQ
jgi:hypothetical protein